MANNHDSEMESFFMTNLLEPKMTFHLSHSRNTIDSTLNLDYWFQGRYFSIQATQQMLQHRAERAILHKKKMKEIEQQYQKNKERKEKSLQQKLQSSEKNKRKGLSLIQQRLKKIQERRHKIHMQVKHRESQSMQKKLEQRKTFEPGGSKHRGSTSRTSQSSCSEERIKIINKELEEAQYQIKNKLDDYRQRQEHAKDNTLFYNKLKAQRAKSHNSIEVVSAKQKAVRVKADRLRAQSQDAMTRLSTLDIVRQKKRKHQEEAHSKKIKHNSQKLRRINNNLLDLDEKNRRRCAQLDQKYVISRSTWKDPRKASQNKRIMQNLHALEAAQKLKTEQILSKHQEINIRNRMFRERRNLLFRNYKNQTLI